MKALISAPSRKLKSARRSRERRRQEVKEGKLLCLCGNVAWKFHGSTAVCQRCSDIENRVTHDYSKGKTGGRRLGGNVATVVMPYVVHCSNP